MTATTASPNPNFNEVLFIRDGTEVPIDPSTRYVYNDGGHTHHLHEPKGTLIHVTPEDPRLSLGHRYGGITWTEKIIDKGETWAYVLTEFNFHAGSAPVVYDPLWADRWTCQAFGITLLRSGESLPFSYPGMVRSDYTYGVYAGHQSPYIEPKRRRDLLTVNATDLEYHAFPHIFSSQDSLPLVISVARWRPERHEIFLADLWVEKGDCLFIPPKHKSEEYTDMHGNRNSAFACWSVDGRSFLVTETTLGNSEVFKAPATKPHYHEEKHPTMHSRPA